MELVYPGLSRLQHLMINGVEHNCMNINNKTILGFTLILCLMFVNISNSSGLDSFKEEFNKSFSPPNPLTSYHYKEDSNWTTWNKTLFGSAIGLYGVGDTITSLGADSRGCVESNPLLGEHPNAGVLIASKLVALGVSWYITEYALEEHEYQQEYRNFLYGVLSVVGGYATYSNATVNCN